MEAIAVSDVTAVNKQLVNTEIRKKNKIQVSNTKKPLYFYVNLAKRYMQQHEEVELSALGMAIATVVTIAEILKNNGLASQKKIMTSTVGMKDETNGRLVQKAKIEILMAKTESLDNMTTAKISPDAGKETAKTITPTAVTTITAEVAADEEKVLTTTPITPEVAADGKEEVQTATPITPEVAADGKEEVQTATPITPEVAADGKEEVQTATTITPEVTPEAAADGKEEVETAKTITPEVAADGKEEVVPVKTITPAVPDVAADGKEE